VEHVRQSQTPTPDAVRTLLPFDGRLGNPAPTLPDTRVSPEAALLEEMVKAGDLGRKTGRGFYEY